MTSQENKDPEMQGGNLNYKLSTRPLGQPNQGHTNTLGHPNHNPVQDPQS